MIDWRLDRGHLTGLGQIAGNGPAAGPALRNGRGMGPGTGQRFVLLHEGLGWSRCGAHVPQRLAQAPGLPGPCLFARGAMAGRTPPTCRARRIT